MNLRLINWRQTIIIVTSSAAALVLVSLLLQQSIATLSWLVAAVAAIQVGRLVHMVLAVPGRDRSAEFAKSISKKLEAFVVCAAALGGLYALDIYKQTNVISTRMALEQRDAAARANYLSPDHPDAGERLMSIFFTDPDIPEPDYVRCEQPTRDTIRSWAHDVLSNVTTAEGTKDLPEWDDVHQLFDLLFDDKTRTSTGMTDVRRAFFHTVDYAYIVQDAYNGKMREVFDDEEYEMWAGYVDDLGPSPIFLMVILDGQESGYMTRSFGDELWRRYSTNSRLHCVAQVLYPELAKDLPTWRGRWGALRRTGLPRQSASQKPSGTQRYAPSPTPPPDPSRPASSSQEVRETRPNESGK